MSSSVGLASVVTMFSSPAPVEFPRGKLKRYHDHEGDIASGSTVGFEEHRNKRQHTLPLRSSPIARRHQAPVSFLQPSTSGFPMQTPHMTPPETYLTEPTDGFCSTTAGGNDMDMDMDCGDQLAQPRTSLESNDSHLEPGPFHPDVMTSDLNGRIPTPIQPSFAAQVRGNNWGGAAGNIMQPQHVRTAPSPLNMEYRATHSMDGAQGYMNSESAVPRTMDHATMNDWSVVQNRSLPSPISETGGEEMGSPGMVLDSGTASMFRRKSLDMGNGGQLKSHSTMSLPLEPREVDEVHGPASPEYTRSQLGVADNAMDTDGPATPSPRKSHTRNRHTVNNWTQQPGMKKSFSIGYRADCEKCRMKVPGHFNHIIVS